MYFNWYKIAQYENIEIFENIEDHDESYISIGHNQKMFPSYLWIFSGGEIISKQVTSEEPSHRLAFREHSFEDNYGGRFDSTTGKLSIKRPMLGEISYFRSVPNASLKATLNLVGKEDASKAGSTCPGSLGITTLINFCSESYQPL